MNKKMKVKSLEIPVSPEIAAFAVVMEAKLQLEGFDHVQDWEGISLQQLAKQLGAKIRKLAALDLEALDPNEAFTKIVVIGSLAMMMAELTSRKRDGAEVPSGNGVIIPFDKLRARA